MAVELLFPPFPAGTIDVPTPLTVTFDTVVATTYDPPVGLALAMVARPFDPDAEVALQYPPFPAGTIDVPDPLSITTLGALTTVTASTIGFNSRGGDDPAHTHFPRVLSESFNFEIELFPGIDPAGSSARSAGVGAIKLTDPGGELDSAVIDYAWDGRDLDLFRGAKTAAFANWTRVARLTTAGILYDPVEKQIRLRDLQWRLYGVELLDSKYDGTGGINGDAGVIGQPRMQSYGRIVGLEPRLIDATNIVYQWHDRVVQSVTGLRDGATAIVIDGDDADLATLLAASIATGHARTCNALGLVRLGATAFYGLRLDGYGDAYSINGFGYVETRAAIARRLATSRSALALREQDQLDQVSFSRFDAAQPAPVGFAFDGSITIGAAIDAVLGGCLGVWWAGLDGRMTVDLLRVPDTSPDFILRHPADIIGDPKMLAWSPPRRQTRMGWRHIWSPQRPEALGDATPTEQRLYGEEWSFALSTDDVVRTRYPTAPDAIVPGNFAIEGNAYGEAVRQQQLLGVRRERWQIDVRLDPFAPVIGKTVEIQGFTRLGWTDPRRFRVVKVTAVASRGVVTLDLWG